MWLLFRAKGTKIIFFGTINQGYSCFLAPKNCVKSIFLASKKDV